MAKYINATGNGRRQIEALVGPAGLFRPEAVFDARGCSEVTMSSKADEAAADDPVVSLTFSCFGESVGIFKDAFWTDVMAGNAYRISKAGGIVEDHSSLGLAAATMLFYQARSLKYNQIFPATSCGQFCTLEYSKLRRV